MSINSGNIEELANKLLDALPGSRKENEERRQIIKEDLEKPVSLIGIGQTGVGKTELLRSIFSISSGDLAILKQLKTGAASSTTKVFYSFEITSPEGFKVRFTDGPGLGESTAVEDNLFERWSAEIPNHDLLYWVLDASSRDISHIQTNMKRILDNTGYREKMIVVLNKADHIYLDLEDELAGKVGWDLEFNMPSDDLESVIEERTLDIIAKLEDFVEISRNQMIVCSARRRWNHGAVLDKLLEYLPKEKRIKASRNRDVKMPTELMSEEAKKEIAELLNYSKTPDS